MKLKLNGTKGISLVELMIAVTLMTIAMLALARGFFAMNSQSSQMKEKTFASQKAIQMMEELRGLISDTSNVNIGVLDDYDDGAGYSYVLTTKRDVTDPADPTSSNDMRKFKRQITVQVMANEPLARKVFVRIYRSDGTAPLAETISILRTINNRYSPTQVYDVYVLSLENVPGWWVSLSTMKPMFDNVIQDLQTRNPGLEWRMHWITRLAYGRDPYYTPFINETTQTNLVAPTQVYFYPGLMDKPSVGDFFYYVPSSISGQINIDGTVTNAGSYIMADQYNHAVRYPDEERLYSAAVTAAQTAGTATPEMSLRMLLETMNSSSATVKNLLLVNLHGELVPLPPMRNYSDPAKDPTNFMNVRAVTHPEKLQYDGGSQVNLRVYTYTMDTTVADGTVLGTTTVMLANTQLTSANITIRKMVGSGTVSYGWQNATLGTDYTISNPDASKTLITIYNSPLRHPANGNYGLPSSDRLYNLEYIPCNVSSMSVFTENVRDLAFNSNTVPKNTARWVIRVAAGALTTGRYSIETRLGDDYTTGTSTNSPTNISRTYVWVATTPPVTEQFQFMGDPRHMPYSDVKNNLGYNWYFTSVNTSDYMNFTNTANGWGGYLNVDIPRYFQVYRNGLLASTGLWTSMTGFSFYYVGLGGEMGYDSSNGFASGLPIVETPWNPSSTASVGVDEITDAQTQHYSRVISNTANTWWGLFWIGELYPDSAFSTWQTDGNLPTGSGNYYRATYSSKGFAWDPVKRTNASGCASFFNGNPTASGNTYFQHEYWDAQTADLTTVGSRLDAAFNFPLLTSLTAGRPFRLNSTSNQPPEWTSSLYTSMRTQLSTIENYYDTTSNTSTHDSSALVAITSGTQVARMVMNGLSAQAAFGSSQISKLCQINLVRGFMASGTPSTTTARIPQVPLVTISSPSATDQFTNPSAITVSWNKTWTRWDGQLYTEGYPSGFTETGTLVENVKYSPDNGRNWYFAQDNTNAQVGVASAAKTTSSPLSWNVSNTATFPRGNYLIRVEVFRANNPLHYTYHQLQIYIQR